MKLALAHLFNREISKKLDKLIIILSLQIICFNMIN